MRVTELVLVLTLCAVLGGSNPASAIGSRRTKKPSRPWDNRILPRGGAFFHPNQDSNSNKNKKQNNVTVEDYVTKMKEKDREMDDTDADAPESSEGAEASASASTPASTSASASASASSKDPVVPDDDNDDDPAIVGVKSHGSSSKKSNAVGDPDGDDDDDDDGDDDADDTELSEFSEWEEIHDNSFEPQVQVRVELVEEEESSSNQNHPSNDNGGGVGVKSGNRGSRRKNKWRSSSSSSQKQQQQLSHDQTSLLQAWMPHVYFPPTPDALAYLDTNARLLDAGTKSRLDRRTLYAALMLEWGSTIATAKTSSGTRKFLPSPTSQALQAALSMATQPQWRLSSPGMNGIRFYAPDQETESTTAGKESTLGMQETVAMALAHSLGCGMLILDDHILNVVRQQMSQHGVSDEALKPAALLQALLTMAQNGKLQPSTNGGSISTCMKRDLSLGLDDPFDERATLSCQDMLQWEEEGRKGIDAVPSSESPPLPLLVFIRTPSSNSLLKSKSAMELLLRECGSEDSIHLITLGKGVDAATTTLPREVTVPHDSLAEPQEGAQRNMQQGGANAPWFGFSPQNQNASGQNDPQGSRRFNIFLARTVDANNQPGILGAIAPPQAGNLFPHMMAMQAQERLQHHQDDDADESPVKAELERWAQLLQQHMEQNGGVPMPPPQFFNASLAATPFGEQEDGQTPPPPSPEVIEETLQQAMAELLDRLAQMNGDGDGNISSELSPDLHKAFAQVLRNDNLRRGIAENLARAAPALSDPKCQGVMLSVFVPPPPFHANRGKQPDAPAKQPPQNNMGGWFQKILNSQEESAEDASDTEEKASQKKQKRVRTMAAAAAVMAASNNKENDSKASDNKAERNLAKLEQVCRPIGIGTPHDPVRAKSWESWISRERGAVFFRHNRRVLNEELALRKLAVQQHTGTRGAGSALRQMLSVRDLGDEMGDVIKCAVELEAAKSLRQHESSETIYEREMSLDVDISLSQLMVGEDGSIESTDEAINSISLQSSKSKKSKRSKLQYLHPSSLETALSVKCYISPSPSGGLSISGAQASHRSREEISALAQDKHERALVSQVVSPQDIGVTYDMIGGLSEVKELLRQSITYPLKFPHLYSEGIAREAVKGVLLFGPPGTGKTMLAKAVATEGGASFLSVDASSVENKWLGESEKNAKAVFTLARRLAPCVIFIDEVDSLLSSREGSSDDSAHGTLTSVKTTMMSEWDGLNSGTNGAGESGSDRVVVIGSTNRPFDLDEAVLRRFPRRILVDLPDLCTRKEILEVTLAENRLDPNVNLTQIAERLEGYTGSDIKEVCREAVVQISHEQARLLDQGFVNSGDDATEGSLQRLRPATSADFESALSKLKRSVSEKGRELMKVWEWNDEYGEIKKERTNHLPQLMNMYL